MRAVASEKGVLKLVHPGRYVEIHKEPVTAAEVMRKNPRHCITRPDVFEYPWVVVKPESVLNLGRVFFIVPNRTIYHLLKERGSPDQVSRQSLQSPFLNGTSPIKSYAGMTPNHLKSSQSLEQLLQNMSWPEASPREEKYGGRFKKQSRDESCPERIVKHERTSFEYGENSADGIRCFNARDYYYYYANDSSSKSWKFSESEDEDIGFEQHSKQVTPAKSCLRKQDSVHQPCHLPPVKDDEGIQKSDTEFPGFSIC